LSDEWINFLRENYIKISMTGKGRCTDNIYIERFWRSLKREEFYLNEYQSVKELKKAIDAYIDFYNRKRWHQALDYKRPADLYFAEERKAFGVVDGSYGPDSALRDVCTN
jgi:putative transposase